MQLRLLQWRHIFGHLKYVARRTQYKSSAEWQQYLLVMREDARRCNSNAQLSEAAENLLCDYASEHRSDGYWQGYLYIAYPIVHVLLPCEQLPALMLVLGALRVYGPHGHEHGYVLVRNHAARMCVRNNRRARSWLHHPMFSTMLCYRWFFILFGQMFAWHNGVPAYLLQVWDFLLQDVLYGSHRRLFLFANCVIEEYCCLVSCRDDVLEDFATMFDMTWTQDSIVRILQRAYITSRVEKC